MKKLSGDDSSGFAITFRDARKGWIHFIPLFYSFISNVVGIALVTRNSNSSLLNTMIGVFMLVHGRTLAAYLVHEAAHGNIFKEHFANHLFGVASLWFAGCPYCDFRHVRSMHIKHHKDRADVVEFDYREYVVNSNPLWKNVILAFELVSIPMVETIHHLRSALYPLLDSSAPSSRRQSATLGVLTTCAIYFGLASVSASALLWYLLSGALMLNFLAFNDAFHHTYEAVAMADYVPGPGSRTASYEEENTFSNLVTCSRTFQWLNALFMLNFGYHNAHHIKPMTPWYDLPWFHETVYGDKGCDQVLPYSDLWEPWWKYRLQRVTDADYGVVAPAGTPRRAQGFVGALGVSFLTV